MFRRSLLVLLFLGGVAGLPAETLDTLLLGDEASETAHALVASFPPVIPTKGRDPALPPPSDGGDPSDIVAGGLGQKARRLLPRSPNPDMYGGQLTFTMKVDPVRQNYFTVKLWGGDKHADETLILRCEGFEIGKRHGNASADLFVHAGGGWLPGRFWYRTATLPLKLTQGKESVSITLLSAGKIYDYAGAQAFYIPKYQHLLHDPSWGIYRAYTHVGGAIDVSSEEQGEAPSASPRTSPGPEVIDLWKEAVVDRANALLKKNALRVASGRGDGEEIRYLAECWEVPWTPAYHNQEAVRLIVRSIDEVVRGFAANNQDFTDQGKYHNDAWGGTYATMARAIHILAQEIQPQLDETVDFGGNLGVITRREGWSKALRTALDWVRMNRRGLTNQEIDSSAGIYELNKGLLDVDPAHALKEEEALRYVYEAVGLLPYSGNDKPGGPAPIPGDGIGNKLWYGPDWRVVTARGLGKEQGITGGDYGEFASQVFDLARLSGDPKLMARALEIARARGYIRFQSTDGDGYPVMMVAEPIGNRNNYLPGHEAYVTRGVSGTGVDIVAHADAPDLLGWFQQQVADGQAYAMIAGSTGEGDSAALAKAVAARAAYVGAPYFPDDFAVAMAEPKTGIPIPTSPEAPDFAWGDEEDMVVAAKHGGECFFANMFWKGPSSIQKSAMVFLVNAKTAALAEVQLDDIRFVPSGESETGTASLDQFPDRNPPDLAQFPNADAGSVWPIPIRPDHVGMPPIKNAEGNVIHPSGGRGTGYTLCYGHWLVGMNARYTTGDYTMKLPADFTSGIDLVSGKTLKAPVVIPQGTTVVFYLPNPAIIPVSSDTTLPGAPAP